MYPFDWRHVRNQLHISELELIGLINALECNFFDQHRLAYLRKQENHYDAAFEKLKKRNVFSEAWSSEIKWK